MTFLYDYCVHTNCEVVRCIYRNLRTRFHQIKTQTQIRWRMHENDCV